MAAAVQDEVRLGVQGIGGRLRELLAGLGGQLVQEGLKLAGCGLGPACLEARKGRFEFGEGRRRAGRP